jgi:uncharacterized BrkB/YihY/UPF0761 family membrane protein
MTLAQIVSPPPIPKLGDYPVVVTVSFELIATMALVFVISRFDATGGSLTISLIVVLAFIGAAVFSVFFTIPNDEATAAILGGLVASFGAVVAHWLGRKPPKE